MNASSTPAHLIWKVECYDESGQVVATLSRRANCPAEFSCRKMKSFRLADALAQINLAARFFQSPHHPALPKPTINPELN